MPDSCSAPSSISRSLAPCRSSGSASCAFRNAAIAASRSPSCSRICPSVNQAEAKPGASSMACDNRSAAATGSPLSCRSRAKSKRRSAIRSPEDRNKRADIGSTPLPVEVGYIRLRQFEMPNSGKPELGGERSVGHEASRRLGSIEEAEPSPATPSLRFGASTSPRVGRVKNRRNTPYITGMRPRDILDAGCRRAVLQAG